MRLQTLFLRARQEGPEEGGRLTPDQLKERRHALGMSQKAAAKALGVAPRTYQNWEMGATLKLPPLLEAALEKLERSE